MLETEHFVVMPTIGQLFRGSMLVLPRRHVETSARLVPDLIDGLSDVVEQVASESREFGEPVIFEHGAISCTGGSCGIYHAHIHVVPLPEAVDPAEFLPSHAHSAGGLREALEALTRSDNYLLFGAGGAFRFGDVGDLGFNPPSQYFRRVLAARFGVDRPWDWRAVSAPEPDLMHSLARHHGRHAPERRPDPL
ncbi:MAG TPA: hypothetical protein VEZ70_03115 [Allosphingosinicella sp.]|nr:hypothetical protein [Allosphingosinicella sp.]